MKKLLTILFILCAVQSFAQYPGPYQGTQRSNLLYTSKVKFTGAAWFTDSTYLQGYARTTTPADGDSSLRIPTTGWISKNYQVAGSAWLIGGNSDAAPPYIGTWANKEIIFITDSAERMKIPANGILRSSSLRNKVLSIDTLTKDVYYTDPTAGAGTVTSVSRTSGYGISASVANATTTPDITITLDTATVFPAVRATIPGGGGTTYTASNGITLSTADFQLGGALSGTTSITGSQILNLGTSGSKLSSLNTNTSGNQGFVADGTISATAPLVYLFGTDSTMILNLDETTEAYPAICRAPNGRLYWKTISGGSTDTASLSARINLKVNISDTATMLSPYLRKIDTAVFSRKSMPAYSIGANNTSGTADATNFTFRSVGSQSISSGVPTWTAGTAPSGTENHSYVWSQIGKQVTVTFYLTYVTPGATCTAVSFPLPTDLPSPLELSGTGAADEILYIGTGYIGTAKTTTPAVTSRPVIKVNSGDTGYDISMSGSSVSARVAYGTITYTAQ